MGNRLSNPAALDSTPSTVNARADAYGGSRPFAAVLSSLAAVVLVLTVHAFPGAAADEQKSAAGQQLKAIRDAIRTAHTGGDAAAYVAKSRELREFLHSSPDSILQVMSAEAFAGDQDAALRSFENFIAMGQSNDAVFQGKQFDELRKVEKFRALEGEMRKNEAPVTGAREVFAMPETGLIPEDIDYDPATRQFYVTSVLKCEILAFDTTGRSRVFARAPDAWPMMALKIDSPRRALWATEVALHPFKSVPEKDWGTSTILIYDLDSGRLLHRVAGPPQTTLGDMTLTKDGDAIVSDNDKGGLYRVNRKTLSVERIDLGDFVYPQTAVMSPDQRHVFVPDYSRGIGILDLATKHVSWLISQTPHAMSGIDGLYLYGRNLIATQNGASPERVVRFELDKSLTHVESESVIERATPTLGDPTHGVIVHGAFYYIANSGWDTLEDDGTPKAGTVLPKGAVMKYEGLGTRD